MAQIIEITDLSAPELTLFAGLTEAQLRNRLERDKGMFIAESPKVIRVALDAGCVPVAFLMERRHLEGQAADILAGYGDVPVYTGSRELLASLTGYTLTRGILCAMRRPEPPSMEEVCRDSRRIAVLEDIVDTTNLGAIFRSAAALGMDGILLSPSCADPLNRRAVRVSMGAVFQIPWAVLDSGTWPLGGIEDLHNMGFKLGAMALESDSVSVDDQDLMAEDKLAIVLGTEGTGLARQTIANSDYTVCIPMAHGVDSLNVAAAAAIAFWQLRPR